MEYCISNTGKRYSCFFATERETESERLKLLFACDDGSNLCVVVSGHHQVSMSVPNILM